MGTMIYALLWLTFNMGLFLGFWLCAVLSAGKTADEQTEQMLRQEDFL